VSYLRDLFEYNLWANEVILAATDQLSPDALATPMPDLGGTPLELLDHTALVQAGFLGLLTGAGRPAHAGDRLYIEVRDALRSSSDGFIAELPKLERRLGDSIEVPWFGRSFTVEQALLQVATHSVQHRAGIAAGVAHAGGTVENLDYIAWLNNHR
jgi:uncharacterized damage-inducible protein DinB